MFVYYGFVDYGFVDNGNKLPSHPVIVLTAELSIHLRHDGLNLLDQLTVHLEDLLTPVKHGSLSDSLHLVSGLHLQCALDLVNLALDLVLDD